ncbi:glycosyltransferase [Rhizobium sp. LC145]|jgi:inositol phosphorylceramide mannosyltransferase catalytic subunit|uniref:glycosyltransferase family 32 protein n=1 Tax=Rhizobium sp. LC145 TaxID=1120688 RepID=UPI0009E4DD55|nr:glycosyltransferase [Rhizobium sp. LC145]TKT58042.1 mannosyltransferase [Rhizobiaceae bacterium LC148]
MKTREYFKEQLRQAEALIAAKRFDDARAILEPLAGDADALVTLGSETSLGLPRRIHSSLLKLAKAESDPIRRVGLQYHLVPSPEVITRHLTCGPELQNAMARAAIEAVPRTIHQVWIGARPVPVTVDAWRRHAEGNGYRYMLWREAELKSIGVYDNAVFVDMLAAGDYPGAVDVARYVILHEQGGIYLDCDWYPVHTGVSFHNLLPMIGLHAIAEAIPRNTAAGSILLANSFIAAPSKHPVFQMMLAALPGLRHQLPSAPAWWVTGPLLFTVTARASALCLAPADFVAANASSDAVLNEVKALAAALEKNASGLLIAWKPW